MAMNLLSSAWIAAAFLGLAAFSPVVRADFVHGIVVPVDGVDYYLKGVKDGPNGEEDIPGHYWELTGKPDKPKGMRGKHYNEGPLIAPINPLFWSSDAPEYELLYVVDGLIDSWSEEKAADYAARGYTHYHEFVKVSDGSFHPDKVLWLKHTARTSFYLDGGPKPKLGHDVSPGVDFEFIPNFANEYAP